MRISDWSSDVCSSDLLGDRLRFQQLVDREAQRDPRAGDRGGAGTAVGLDHVAVDDDLPFAQLLHVDDGTQATADKPLDFLRSSRLLRSEEHTSELQSLMRNSYAVFCLKQTHNSTQKTRKNT